MPNAAPNPMSTHTTTHAGVPVAFSISPTDPDGDPITLDSISLAGTGTGSVSYTATSNPPGVFGTWTWTPPSNTYLTDTFVDYTISDDHGHSVDGYEWITPTNVAPYAGVWHTNIYSDQTFDFDWHDWASDTDGDTLSLVSSSLRRAGTESVAYNSATSTFTYTPPSKDWTGTAFVDWTISDGNTGTDNGYWWIDVTPRAIAADDSQ